jgi:hydroxymethylpyrimidine pyrophosphatase-like HAD family hydrolase
MKPLEALGREEGARIDGLLFDLDDTFLSHGVLLREAYDALWDLHDGGVKLVVVTGRPSAWGELVVKQWPIDAATTENGAVPIVRADAGRRVVRVDGCEPAERARRRGLLEALAADVAAGVPEVKLAVDRGGRLSDVAWDVGEDVVVPRDRVAAVEAIIAEHGARSSLSSVHLHATFDADDKATGTMRLLASRFGVDVGAARVRWAFVGDSGNDRACFSAFETTFGVANVRASLGALALPPRYVARAEMGEGFAEIARALLRCKMR